jgi:glycine/D-amino acid oxidase-like deaminating enzyme
MNRVASADGISFPRAADVLVIGAGTAGLCAARAAAEWGAEPLVVERDPVPSGSTQGYSEQAASVLRQPGGIALDIFDERIAATARQFPDFRDA